MRTALIAGATGLTGGHLLSALLDSNQYGKVHALVRKPALPPHPKLDELIVDFAHLPRLPRVDDAYCCLGTTIRKAGSQAAFRLVDFDYVVNFAKAARRAGARQFLLISAIGADAKSAVFYSRVKGETEEALRDIGFEALHLFRPSFLVGDRQESRLGERVGIAAFSLAAPLMMGAMRKYRPVEASVVAAAMLNAALSDATGVVVHDSAQIAADGAAARQ